MCPETCWSNFRLFIGLLEASSIVIVSVLGQTSSHCCKCCFNILQVHQVSFSSFPPFRPFKVHPRFDLWSKAHARWYCCCQRCVATLITKMLPCPQTCLLTLGVGHCHINLVCLIFLSTYCSFLLLICIKEMISTKSVITSEIVFLKKRQFTEGCRCLLRAWKYDYTQQFAFHNKQNI